MLLSQLEYFLSVVRNQGVTRSAKELTVGQSTVSHQIKRLEHQLGVELFRRSGRSLELTPAGRALVKRAERILQEVHAAEEEMRQFATVRPRERINFGIVMASGLRYLNVPTLLAEFGRRCPEVELQVTQGLAQQLLPMLAAGRCDLALFLHHDDTPVPPGLHLQRLFRQEYGLVAPRGHPLTQHRSVALTDLEHESLLLPTQGSPVRAAVDAAFLRADVRLAVPPRELSMTDPAFRFELLKEGFGLAFLPENAREVADSDVKWMPLRDADVSLWVTLAWRNEPAPRGVLRDLIDLALEWTVGEPASQTTAGSPSHGGAFEPRAISGT